MSETQLTLQDWEKLYNMLQEQRDQIRQLEARIPKTGLLSPSMLTRIVTVCGYLFIAQIAWFLVGAFVLNYWLITLGLVWVIILLVIIVRWIRRSETYYNEVRTWTTD